MGNRLETAGKAAAAKEPRAAVPTFFCKGLSSAEITPGLVRGV
jgi:hypothetical protein